jgi:RNA polymerase sporulation-specific sigma factor
MPVDVDVRPTRSVVLLEAPAEPEPAPSLEGPTDEVLIARVRAGDEVALVELLERYRPFARVKARPYFLAGGDREDVVQEAMIGLYKAVRDYEPARQSSFRSFADLCITRQILTAVKAATRQKHAPLNAYVPLDVPESPGSTRRIGDAIQDEAGDDPVRCVLADDELTQLRDMVRDLLSDLEAEVLDLYVEGRSYQEIAEHLGRHVKSVDNAIQRIKRKLETEFRDRVVA